MRRDVNGKMYVSEFQRKCDRLLVSMIYEQYRGNECEFVKKKAKWIEKEWRRLQKIS